MWFLTAVAVAQDDPWALIRVDDPNHPDAISRSHLGSVLEAPPEAGTAWRIEEMGVVDQVGQISSGEAIDAMNVQPWHDAGFTGEGVSVAVFDLQWFGAELSDAELGSYETWDCWAHEGCTPEIDTLRPRFSYETGVHGTACAEIVREVAPDAELHLVRSNGVTAFENAAAWAVREEIDIVTLSMSYMNNSFYDGTGGVSAIVEEMSEGGVLLVTSAGNYADGHWSGPFTDTDGDGLHEFDDGSERLRVYFRAGKKRGIAMQWDNYRRCGDTDLDIVVYSADGTVLDAGEAVQEPDADQCSPVERVAPTLSRDQWAEVEIRRAAGDPAVMINLITSSGKIERSMPEHSVTDPGTHPLAWTVGAVNATGYLVNPLEGFSSQGPNFAGDPKPNIAAPDGITTGAYGPTGFFGTSAASPSAAAALAVVMSSDPSLTARQAADRVEGWATSDRTSWQQVDNAEGAGRLRLPDPDGELPGCLGRGVWLGAVFVLPWGWTRRRGR
ncbi:MAG: S8 family serine peptidase [Proteobacteria bacterium]|nr:S8 family serine peptidase [Pseudomonadota bacterium]MCP4917459.1 S8 family serine peptidase [Pseudomonadota bacterium]